MLGALLLLATPASIFARLVPWLILFATCVFAYGSFRKPQASDDPQIGRAGAVITQVVIGLYLTAGMFWRAR